MATWRQKFEGLSTVEREEIGKWKGGANNIPALRQAMEAEPHSLRRKFLLAHVNAERE